MNKKIFNNFIWLMRYNLGTLFTFELFYKGLALIFIWPFTQYLMHKSIEKTGYVYLVTENLVEILTNPVAVLLILSAIILLGFYVFFEITAVVICIDEARKNNKIGVVKLIELALKRSLVILRPRNILLVVFVVLIIPLTNFTLTSGLIGRLNIPEYILDFISSNTVLNIIYTIFIFFLYILVTRWSFSVYEMTLNTDEFNKAIKESLKFTKGKLLKIVAYSVGLFIGIFLLGIILNYAGIVLIAIFSKYFSFSEVFREEFISRIVMFNSYFNFAASIFVFLINIGFFLTLYYEYKGIEINKNKIKRRPLFIKKDLLKNLAKLAIIIVVISMETSVIYHTDQSIFNLEMFYNTTATAHRGASLEAPENTLAAFNKAVDSNSGYVELDVQEAKDGELVILHDSNLKRTTGVDKNVWEATSSEIKKYDAGSYFSESFKGEKIPTLKEVLDFSKGKVKLLIEIKLHGHEKDNVVKKVIDLIKENNMENQCIIGSMDRNLLKEVKSIDRNIITCYITAFAYGNLYDWDFVDIYSIEATFVNRNVVNEVHSRGKQIFVWTVNNPDEADRLLDLNVDSIVTDNPSIVTSAIYEKNSSFVKLIADKYFKSIATEAVEISNEN